MKKVLLGVYGDDQFTLWDKRSRPLILDALVPNELFFWLQERKVNLDRDRVTALIEALQHWLETGGLK